jgi:hypothetical protein
MIKKNIHKVTNVIKWHKNDKKVQEMDTALKLA